jgi:uncharacterized protein (DUF924 family)
MSTTPADLTKLEEVVKFWSTLDAKKKFTKDPEFDELLISKYSSLHRDLMMGEYDEQLKTSPMPAVLGAVIVLDQFSRNMFRGSPESFTSDPKALALAKEAIQQGCEDAAGDSKEWLYMPFMHSEELSDQILCVNYFATSSWVSETLIASRPCIYAVLSISWHYHCIYLFPGITIASLSLDIGT